MAKVAADVRRLILFSKIFPHVGGYGLFEPQHILHVVETGLLLYDPQSRAERTVGEGIAARSLVRQFHPFPVRGENDRVIAHDIATAYRMHANLFARAFADDAFATVAGYRGELLVTNVSENFCQRFGCAAGRVLFQAVTSQDTKTPALIALGVLVLTQLLNFVFLPLFAHAALTLTVGIGAVVNALWLLVGLIRRGSYKPQPGWGIFLLQVLAAVALMAVFLMWANSNWAWTQMWGQKLQRVGLIGLVIMAAAAIYFVAALAAGLKWRQFFRKI